MRYILLFLLFLTASALLYYGVVGQNTAYSVVNQNPSLNEGELWSLIQRWRVENNLPAYIKDQRLCTVAIDRSDDGDDNHQGLYDKYSDFPYVIQENATFSNSESSNEETAFNSWLNSPAHLTTLKKEYKYSCVKTHNKDAVQIFSNF